MPNAVTRIRILGSLIAAAFMVIVVRLCWLQLAQAAEYAAKALGNRTDIVTRAAPRGLIYDRRGLVLAENRDVWNVNVVPSELPSEEDVLEGEIGFLASTLSTEASPVSTADVREAIEQARQTGAVEATELKDIGQDLTFDQVADIEERLLELPGIVVTTTTRRHYPFGALAGHAVGRARRIQEDKLEEVKDIEYPEDPQDPTAVDVTGVPSDYIYDPESIFGEEGVESLCELEDPKEAPIPILPGRRARSQYEVDATGAPQRLLAAREAVPGASVYLTLDARCQYVAERALKAAISGHSGRMGAVVVMDANNGDVLVLASEPCLDLNDWAGGMTPEQWEEANDPDLSPGLPLLNKAIAGKYPPGSTFKVISACAALEQTDITPATMANCTGRITVGRRHRVFKCWIAERGGHGWVNFYEAIGRSCNIFFYESVRQHKLDPDVIGEYARRFGLGEVTGLGLLGEVAGEVPSAEFSVQDSGRPWRQGNSLNFVIGQDRLTVTPLQMCVVAAGMASEHDRIPVPNLVKRIRWPGYLGREDTRYAIPRYRKLHLQPGTLRAVRRGMRLAVTDDHGTVRALSDLPIRIAGKTGSAQHNPSEATHAWFVGFAEQGDRKYAICVFVGSGGTGAQVCVPVARQVLRALFGLHEAGDPAFKLPEAMDPDDVARARRRRAAAAKARAEARRARAASTSD